MTANSGINRRQFLGAAGIAAAGVAAAGVLSSCSSESSNESGENSGSSSSSGTSDALEAAAAPIDPVEPPESWDQEVDVLIVGAGGGGLAAALYAAQQGANTLVVEKLGYGGGATRQAATFGCNGGGTKIQEEMGYHYTGDTFDPVAIVNDYQPIHQYTLNDKLSINLTEIEAECIDWLTDQGNIPLEFNPTYMAVWQEPQVNSGEWNNVLGLNDVMNAIEDDAIDAGAEFMFNTTCDALVVDDDKVVGIKATGEDGDEIYIKGDKGVLLCAGGFGMNRGLLKKYIPSAYEAAATGGPMPWHTGEAFRMGLGVGADVSGYNSFSCWEGGIDYYDYTDEDTEMNWHYFWWGPRQLLNNAWLRLDKNCNRIGFYSNKQPQYQCSYNTMGELTSATVPMNSIGHRAYVILDNNYEENINQLLDYYVMDQCRIPIDPDKLCPAALEEGLVTTDWKQEVKDAIDDGIIKKADTLEELAEEVGLDPDKLVAAVDRWNEICAQGEDTDLPIPYLPEWLIPLENPPYYCAKVSGFIGKTMCGLRVDENMHVINADGDQIPGLYACWSTAGGIAGENNYGTQWFNTSPFGASCLSTCSGYMACKSCLEDK